MFNVWCLSPLSQLYDERQVGVEASEVFPRNLNLCQKAEEGILRRPMGYEDSPATFVLVETCIIYGDGFASHHLPFPRSCLRIKRISDVWALPFWSCWNLLVRVYSKQIKHALLIFTFHLQFWLLLNGVVRISRIVHYGEGMANGSRCSPPTIGIARAGNGLKRCARSGPMGFRPTSVFAY